MDNLALIYVSLLTINSFLKDNFTKYRILDRLYHFEYAFPFDSCFSYRFSWISMNILFMYCFPLGSFSEALICHFKKIIFTSFTQEKVSKPPHYANQFPSVTRFFTYRCLVVRCFQFDMKGLFLEFLS